MPLLTLHVAALTGPLLLRRHAESDFTVEIEAAGHGRLTVGRIMAVARSGGSSRWMWTITGPAAPDCGLGLSGDAESRKEAQEAFRLAWDALLAWGGGRLGWQIGAERVGGDTT